MITLNLLFPSEHNSVNNNIISSTPCVDYRLGSLHHNSQSTNLDDSGRSQSPVSVQSAESSATSASRPVLATIAIYHSTRTYNVTYFLLKLSEISARHNMRIEIHT